MRKQREEEDRKEERNLRRCEAKKRKRNVNLNPHKNGPFGAPM
jgi:hypothetical protein